MGNVCAHNRSISRFGFFLAVVKSISSDQRTLRVYVPSRKLTIDVAASSAAVSKGDEVYCFLTGTVSIVTPVKNKEGTEVRGEVRREGTGDCYLLQTSGEDTAVLPLSALQTSFEIGAKPVQCLLTRTAAGLSLKLTKYNPFLYYTTEDQGEKRPIARYRSPLTDTSDNPSNLSQLLRLRNEYTAFRRVKRDGNAFFRCVFSQLLEHFCRKTTALEELETFMGKVDSKLSYFAMLPEYQQYADRVSAVLHKLRNVKVEYGAEALVCVQWILQDPSVDLAALNYIRLLVANYTALHYRSARLKRFMNADAKEVVKNLLAFNQEPDVIIKYVLPDLLQVVILQQDVSIDCDEIFESLYTPDSAGTYPLLHICKSASGSYHILYSAAQSEIDGYDCQFNTYDLLPASEAMKQTAEELYQNVGLDRHSIQT